jgi:hypothetical protein
VPVVVLPRALLQSFGDESTTSLTARITSTHKKLYCSSARSTRPIVLRSASSVSTRKRCLNSCVSYTYCHLAALYAGKRKHAEALAIIWRQVKLASEYLTLAQSSEDSDSAACAAAEQLQWHGLCRIACYIRRAAAGHSAVEASSQYILRLLSGEFSFAGVVLGLLSLLPTPLVESATGPDMSTPLSGGMSVQCMDPLLACQMISSVSLPVLDVDGAARMWLLQGNLSGASAASALLGLRDTVAVDKSELVGAFVDERLLQLHSSTLQALGPLTSTDAKRLLLTAYLEHLVMICGCCSSHVHTLLALQLICTAVHLASSLKSCSSDLHVSVAAASAGCSPSSDHCPSVILAARTRLLLSLTRANSDYDAGIVLRALPPTGFWNERVVLLQRLGQHSSAVSVLADELHDLQGAEDYCRRLAATLKGVCAADSMAGALERYVEAALRNSHETGMSVASPATVERVVRFSASMIPRGDQMAVARLLPASTPLSTLVDFISCASQHTQNRRRALAITSQLAELQHRTAQFALNSRRKVCAVTSVTVRREDKCPVCDRRLAGSGGSFAGIVRLPSGVVLHITCLSPEERSRISESTSEMRVS